MTPDDMESPLFDSTHFPECASTTDEDSICTCDAIEVDLRDTFAAMTRENY